jgi:hypothetical protein
VLAPQAGLALLSHVVRQAGLRPLPVVCANPFNWDRYLAQMQGPPPLYSGMQVGGWGRAAARRCEARHARAPAAHMRATALLTAPNSPALLQEYLKAAPAGRTVDAGASGQQAAAAAGPAHSAASIQREVESALQEVLGRALGPEEPLMSGGLDSLGAVEYVNLVGRWAARLGAGGPGLGAGGARGWGPGAGG